MNECNVRSQLGCIYKLVRQAIRYP